MTFERSEPEWVTSSSDSDFGFSTSSELASTRLGEEVVQLAMLDTSRRDQPPRLRDQVAGTPTDQYQHHQGSLDVPPVGPPAPDGGNERRNFQVHRGTDGQVDRIDLQGGLQMRRNGNDWQLMRGDQPVTGDELRRFANENPLRIPLAVTADGKIQGRITQKENGDITYDARGTSINTISHIRADGSRDIRNFNDYSRRILPANGGPEDKTFWDGYQWRHGAEQRGQDGRLTVTFDQNEQRPQGSNRPWPRSIVRDANTDQLTVVHDNNTTMTANWREQRLVTQNGQQQSVRYFDGQNWREGRPAEQTPRPGDNQNQGNDAQHLRRIQFTDNNPNGPGEVVIDTRTGEIKERIPRRANPNPGPDTPPRPRPTPTPVPQPRR